MPPPANPAPNPTGFLPGTNPVVRVRRCPFPLNIPVNQAGNWHRVIYGLHRNFLGGLPQNLYHQNLLLISIDFWNSIPQQFKNQGFFFGLIYDFQPSQTGAIRNAGFPAFIRAMNLPARSAFHNNAGPDLAFYSGHTMTSLGNPPNDARTVQAINTLAQLQQLIQAHLVNRASLETQYMNFFDAQNAAASPAYHSPNHVILTATVIQWAPGQAYGADFQTFLQKRVLNSETTCFWEALKTVLFDKAPRDGTYPHCRSTAVMRQSCGGHGPKVALTEVDGIEACLSAQYPARPVRIIVFDAQLALRRLPFPLTEAELRQGARYASIVFKQSHIFTFQSPRVARMRLEIELSFFKALAQLYLNLNDGDDTRKQLHTAAWQLFRESQHLQPDRGAVEAYLAASYGVSAAKLKQTLVNPSDPLFRGSRIPYVVWVPKTAEDFTLEQELLSGARKLQVAALMPEQHARSLGVVGPDAVGKARRQYPAEMRRLEKEQVPIFVKPEMCAFDTNVVSMDIETASCVQSHPGRFLTYAVGWRFGDTYREIVAQTPDDLDGRILFQAINEWQRLADDLNGGPAPTLAPLPGGDDEAMLREREMEGLLGGIPAEPKKRKAGHTDGPQPRKQLYIYAFNGSTFDVVACIRAILTHAAGSDGRTTPPSDLLVSNGRYISVKFGDLVFRDARLITQGSLAAAATSFGLQATKGYLPHQYLQNCIDAEDILRRLHATVRWDDLLPYIDWFAETGEAELHQRKAGRTHEEWIEEQPVRKFFVANREREFNFCNAMRDYLRKDVDVLHQLVMKVGAQFAEDFGVDIRVKCTLGSVAQTVWQSLLYQPIDKLCTEELHTKWNIANRGGYCGVMSEFQYTCRPGEKIYKFDVTSLYPAASCPIEFVTSAGLQKPIEKYGHGIYPLPQSGQWLRRDFRGLPMTKRQYKELEDMHGLLEIEFDQTHMANCPFFKVRLESGVHSSFAPVCVGRYRFTIPHVRMGFDYGVRIYLHECLFTPLHTQSPFSSYMRFFGDKKNAADAVKARVVAECAGAEPTEAQQEALTKAAFDRTVAKLFLNGLLGRCNMRIERTQTVITNDVNEVACMLGDPRTYRDVDVADLLVGPDDNGVFTTRYLTGDYLTNIRAFEVVPHLSAYMLGYAKMLMEHSFFHMRRLGCQLLYTDTDSILAVMTPEQAEEYMALCVPTTKTLGGMELEGTYHSFMSVGPKKYCCVKENGDYEWAGNGIRARTNAGTDLLETYRSVLNDRVEEVAHFSITSGRDYTLTHTSEDAVKRIRFICLKGALEEGAHPITGERQLRIRCWKDEKEFAEYASRLRPICDSRDHGLLDRARLDCI